MRSKACVREMEGLSAAGFIRGGGADRRRNAVGKRNKANVFYTKCFIPIQGQRIVNRLRQKIFGSIIRQETAFFDKNPTGELINRLSTDTTLVGKAITDNISDGLRSLAQGVAGVSLMVCFL